MCGIAGVIYSDKNRTIDSQTLVNMAAIQYHRGPDNFGYYNPHGAGVGLSHARLTIIDLDEERGRQPHVSGDGRYMMVHNGEFYDFQRIRADMTAQGARFQSKSDSELVLQMYPHYGIDKTVANLRGEFAFSIYDREEETMYLVRDRFGIKPLYWTETEHGIVFGSELKVLFAHPDVKREIDSEGLYHQLIQVMVPGSTAFKGIKQVPPGHWIKIQRKGGKLKIEQHKYWDINFPQAEEHLKVKEEQEYIDGVREQLLEAVDLRLNADVPVGAYLSGGIDSCSILGLSASVRQDPVKAFTIGFDDADYDETPIAREMAEMTGAEQIILPLSAEHLYDHFERTIWHTERTIYNTLGVAKLLMSQKVREQGYKVVLTGEGSDELFAGYPAFRKDMFLYGLSDLPDNLKNDLQATLAESNELFKGAMLPREEFHSDAIDQKVGFTPTCIQSWMGCDGSARHLMAKEHRSNIQDYDPGTAMAEQFDETQLAGRHPLDKAQYVWIKTMLEGQILTWGGDRVDMANSMEARPPFLDHHLADYAVNIPPQMRIKGPVEKYVLKEAMKGLLPETLYKRQKFAFMAPPAHTDQKKWQALMTLMNEFASEEKIKEAGLIDYDALQQMLQSHDDPSVSRDYKVQMDALLNHVLGVQLLHHHFVKQDIPKRAAAKAHELGWAA